VKVGLRDVACAERRHCHCNGAPAGSSSGRRGGAGSAGFFGLPNISIAAGVIIVVVVVVVFVFVIIFVVVFVNELRLVYALCLHSVRAE